MIAKLVVRPNLNTISIPKEGESEVYADVKVNADGKVIITQK